MAAKTRTLVVLVFTALFFIPEIVLAKQVEVLWLGHATVRITSI